MSTPTPPPPPDTPQVLLFGHTGAGKSALLGALLKAGETQGPTLRGEVVESSGRLASIRDAVYHGNDLQPATAEITSYTVRLRPLRPGAAADPVTITFNDCSGQAAESLFLHPEWLREVGSQPPVARAVVEADAIVLMVDGSSDDDELLEAFEEFDTFLTIVARSKADARMVGGFPVLLVLTRCDELADPGDTLERWERRVNKRADEAWVKFDKFLKDADDADGVVSPFLPFGGMDLTVYAVAVRHPKLVGVPAQGNVPYQVAELFRDCFTVARSHRARVTASDRRLRWTVRLVLTFVTLLFLGAITIGLFQPAGGGPALADRVRAYQQSEPEADVRLAYPYLTRNKNTLAAFSEDSAFRSLPDDLREYVEGRRTEIAAYETFRGKLLTSLAPGDTRTLDDLEKVEASLAKGELALPEAYGWGKTVAAQLRDKWLADAGAIRAAEARYLHAYLDFVRRGTVLMLRPSLGDNWRADVAALLEEAARVPAEAAQPLPGSPALEQPRGEALTNSVPFNFERVYNARTDWEAIRNRLTHLRDLGDALGLTAGAGRPDPPTLVLPEPERDKRGESLTLPRGRYLAVLRLYPYETDEYREWELRNFPDPVRSLLADRLDRTFRTGVRHVHRLLRDLMGPDLDQFDTPAWWRSTADVLGDPATAYPDWGRFLHLLARVRQPTAANPVGELAAFLRAETFEINLQGFDLLLQPDPGLGKFTPAGAFVLTHTPRGSPAATRTYTQSGAGSPEGSATSYRFRVEGDGKLVYKPGDELRAELPVRAGGQDFKLVWETTGTRTFQFDRLAREPRLVKPGGASELAAGARLAPTSDSTLPRLPVLFPELRR